MNYKQIRDLVVASDAERRIKQPMLAILDQQEEMVQQLERLEKRIANLEGTSVKSSEFRRENSNFERRYGIP